MRLEVVDTFEESNELFCEELDRELDGLLLGEELELLLLELLLELEPSGSSGSDSLPKFGGIETARV